HETNALFSVGMAELRAVHTGAARAPRSRQPEAGTAKFKRLRMGLIHRIVARRGKSNLGAVADVGRALTRFPDQEGHALRAAIADQALAIDDAAGAQDRSDRIIELLRPFHIASAISCQHEHAVFSRIEGG